ncbi:hypothetical protein AXG93_3052s1100 [Marchantia polymorpha subsp. ruderalis]|uniref:Uncharacterized protein n=1 Tax=Marchantia polymorpha subsp. ruderalis TaxID=1480154 RepID=A0A176WI43_MARPO|nr:hypothetical protein AXG93_3052s1100 [Marchantia polymorpha subsp. ruderalis]
MVSLTKLHALKVLEVGLRAHCRALILSKMNILLVTREEKSAYATLFKHSSTKKNGYRTIWYHDRLRQNVAMALMQIFRPARTTYMMTWQVGFVERALQGDRIHWARIFWTATRQHIGLIPGGSACYLFPFFINFYRGMGLLTIADSRNFSLQDVAPEGEEVVSANEVDSYPEDESRKLPQQRRKRLRGKQESQPRKRRRIDEAAVAEDCWRRVALLKLRLSNSRAWSKMKPRRLILEEDSSTESRGVASRGRPSRGEAEPEATTVREKEAPEGKGPWTLEVRSTPVEPSRATRKDKEKAVLTEEVTPRQNEVLQRV